MSAGFNNIEDANKFGVASFRYGQEGFNYLSDFLANTPEDKLGVNFQEIVKRSVYDATESTSLKERIGVVVKELDEKQSKGDLTKLETTVREQAKEIFELFDAAKVLKYKKAHAEELASKVQFSGFAIAYMGQRKRDPSKLDTSMKIGVGVIHSEIAALVDKDPNTIAKPGHVWGFYVGENFDAFTKILSNVTVEVELAVANFIAEESDFTYEQVKNFKNQLKRYKEAFPTLGAQLKNNALIRANIEKVEAVLVFDPENKNTRESIQFDRIFAGGVDGIGKQYTKVFSKEEFLTKGVNFDNFNQLLKTPEGVAAIITRLKSYDKADQRTVYDMIVRFRDVYLDLHKDEAVDAARAEEIEKFEQSLEKIVGKYSQLNGGLPVDTRKPKPAPSVDPGEVGQSISAPTDVTVEAMKVRLTAELDTLIAGGAALIGTKNEDKTYTKGDNYQTMLMLVLSKNSGAVIDAKTDALDRAGRKVLKKILETFSAVMFYDETLPAKVKEDVGINIGLNTYHIDTYRHSRRSRGEQAPV